MAPLCAFLILFISVHVINHINNTVSKNCTVNIKIANKMLLYVSFSSSLC